MNPVWGAADVPRNSVELIADTMLAAADETAAALGVDVTKAIVAIVINGQPEGEPDAVNAGAGYADGEALFRDLVQHANKTAEQLGVMVRIVRIGGDQ